MHTHKKKFAFFLCILCALLLASQPSFGLEPNDEESHELIILFDNSTSMSWNDTGFLAPDAIKQIISSLPSDWRVGLVTFRAEVIDAVPPGTDTWEAITAILEGVRYTNFTNSGAGLQQAMELFSDHARSRTILFVTDGEMAYLPTYTATAEAMVLAEEMIAQIIESDIQVHTISIGKDFWATHEAILGLAHATGGTLFQDVPSEGLSEVASTLVFDVLGVARSQVGAAQIVDSMGTFTIRLPAVGLDSARVLLTAERPIDHIVVSGNGSNVSIQRGRRFAIVAVDRPLNQTIEIEFSAVGASHASLILEWDVRLMAEAHTDGVTKVWLTDSTGAPIQFDPFSSRQFFPIEAQIQTENGLRLDPATKEALQTWHLYLRALGINTPDFFQEPIIQFMPFVADEPDSVAESDAINEAVPPLVDDVPDEISIPEANETERRFPLLTVIVLCVALVLLFLILLFRFRSKQTKQAIMPPPIEDFDRRFAFTGKLDLYVSLIPSDDASPETAHVIRLGKSRVLDLQGILQKCRIPGNFPGADQIYFAADNQGALQVLNDSDISIFIESTVLAEKQSHTLSQGERVRVYDEDDTRELLISPRFLYRPGGV